MKIMLLQGEFSHSDGIGLIKKMIALKMKFHEKKIAGYRSISMSNTEEDLKFRQAKIAKLHKELYNLMHKLDDEDCDLRLDSIIKVEIIS